MAKPNKLNSERIDIICERLAEGDTIVDCAAASGISEQTLGNWLRRARDAEPLSLLGKLHFAYSNLEVVLSKKLSDGTVEVREEFDADGNLLKTTKIRRPESEAMTAFRLRSLYPEKWGAKATVRVESDGATISENLANVGERLLGEGGDGKTNDDTGSA